MALSTAERAEFLAEPHVAVLSVAAGDGRGPVIAPVWYRYQPGGDVVVITGGESRKARLVRDAGRFTLTVQRVRPSYRYAAVEGPVSFGEVSADALTEVAARYLPHSAVSGYVQRMLAMPDPMVALHLTPERWNAADLGQV